MRRLSQKNTLQGELWKIKNIAEVVEEVTL